LGGDELTEGVHYMEVELGGAGVEDICVGIARPGLDTADGKDYAVAACMDAWFMYCGGGTLFGNGKDGSDEAGAYQAGDRVGMLIDLDAGSLQFFKNGVKHGPGWGAGLVTGPVVLAMQIYYFGQSGRVLTEAKRPTEVGSGSEALDRLERSTRVAATSSSAIFHPLSNLIPAAPLRPAGCCCCYYLDPPLAEHHAEQAGASGDQSRWCG
jgi:hypothetical protein